jgi:hypothetical protein
MFRAVLLMGLGRYLFFSSFKNYNLHNASLMTDYTNINTK